MKLEEGEGICDQCIGTGYELNIPIERYNAGYYNKHYKCSKCQGEGKLDWVENIVGKKPKIKFDIRMNFGMKINPNTIGVISNCAS